MSTFHFVLLLLAVLALSVSFLLQLDIISSAVWDFIDAYWTTWAENDRINVINSWRKLIKPPSTKFTEVIIGWNVNLDLIIPAIPFILALNMTTPKRPSDHSKLTSLEDLVSTFAYFFQQGYAAERPMADSKLFKRLVALGNKIQGIEHFVGGNAALIAQMMAEMFGDEISVNLVGPVGPEVRKRLDKRIHIPDQCQDQVDEVHVILEYPVDSSWESYRSPVANRFIFSHDRSNTKMSKLYTLTSEVLSRTKQTLDSDSPRRLLTVVSGLHLLESLPRIQWKSQVARVMNALTGWHSAGSRAPFVHLELASSASRERMRLLAGKLLPLVDSLGLNEQELAHLSQSCGGPYASFTDPRTGQPNIELVLEVLTWLLGREFYAAGVGAQAQEGDRSLEEDWAAFGADEEPEVGGRQNSRDESVNEKSSSGQSPSAQEALSSNYLHRIHFHSLTFHVLAVRVPVGENQYYSLEALSSAVSAGARTAGYRACNLTVEQLEMGVGGLRLRMPTRPFRLGTGQLIQYSTEYPNSTVLAWRQPIPGGNGEHELRFALSPVLVCRQPMRTVGLGDSISATGLMFTPRS